MYYGHCIVALFTVCVFIPVLSHPRHKLHDFAVENARSSHSLFSPLLTSAVTVTPSSGLKDGDWVTVQVSNSQPHKDDGVVAYSPSSVNVSATAPIEYFVVSAVQPEYLTTGTATLYFRLINMRSDYVFYLMRDVPASPTAISVSNPVTFANPNEPRAVRILLTGKTSEMRVMWSSANTDNSPRVEWWPKDNASDIMTSQAVSSTYSKDDLCNAPATTIGYRDVGIINTAIINGLELNRDYLYRVGDDIEMTNAIPLAAVNQDGIADPQETSLNVLVYGDMGQLHLDNASQVLPFPPAPNTTKRIAEEIESGWPTTIFHIGDISYAMGYASLWDNFFAMLDAYNVSGRIPYHVNLGNHESDDPSAKSGSYYNGTDSGGECSVPATNLFLNPQPSLREPWYALTVGPLTAIHISTEFNFTTGSPQWQFIADTIHAVNVTKTPWTGLFMHRPMYVDSNGTVPPWGSQPVSHLLQQHVEPLFYRNDGSLAVDVVMAGHFHDYQRHCAVRNYTCVTHSAGTGNVYQNPKGPVHLVIGTAGAPISCCRYPTMPVYTEYVNGTYGFGRLSVHNSSHLEWNFVADADGSVVDTMWIVK